MENNLFDRVLTKIKDRRERLLSGKINCIPWGLPRFENENNTLIAKPVGLIELGLKPIYLDNDILTNEINIAKKYSHRVLKNSILAKSQWKI